MKPSYYNIEIESNGCFLHYNAFNDSYILLKEKNHYHFKKNEHKLQVLRKENPKLYCALKKNGFIIKDCVDEKSKVLFERINRKFSTLDYNIIINPTMDCNLSCWYCIQKHRPKSMMSNDILQKTINHVKYTYEQTSFKNLYISFFGGEPLLGTQKVVIPFLKQIKTFAKEKNISFKIGLTTNATLISEDLLNELTDIHTTFQITLDGDEKLHNKIRKHKQNYGEGTYKIIKDNINLIQNTTNQHHTMIRINFTKLTLSKIKKVIRDFNFVDKKHTTFNLYRVWQEKQTNINVVSNLLIEILDFGLNQGFLINYMPLGRSDMCCYADNIDYISINFDGKVYGCTARDYTLKNNVGRLLKNGSVKWKDNGKIFKRFLQPIPKMCENCKFLPSCSGICSQHILDKNISCVIKNSGLSFLDYMFYNFKRRLIQDKLRNRFSYVKKD